MGIFRLVLALSVLLGHTRGHGFFGLSFVYREIAVQTFFMISGFYMALVLNEKYNRPGQYGRFLTQRFLRLYPTYFILGIAVLIIDLAVWSVSGHAWGSLKYWHDNRAILTPWSVAFLVLENLIVFGQDVVMLLRVNPLTGVFHLPDGSPKSIDADSFMLLGVSWSLAVEFSFYLLAPFLVRRPARVQFFLLAAGLLLRVVMDETIPDDANHWIYCLFPPNLCFFLAGSLSYLLYKNHSARLKRIATSQPWWLMLFAAVTLDYSRLPYSWHLYWIWMPMVFLAVPTLFALTCRNRLDRLIGELSYPVYLIHSHVLLVTVPFFSTSRSPWLMGPVSVLITLGLAYLFYRLIELRTERFRESLHWKSEHHIADPAAVAEAPDATLPVLGYTNKPS